MDAKAFRAKARAIAANRGWRVDFTKDGCAWFLDGQGRDVAQSTTMEHLDKLAADTQADRELYATSSTLPARRVLLPHGFQGASTPLQVLEWVAYELDATHWTADTCARVALRLQAAGFAIRDPEEHGVAKRKETAATHHAHTRDESFFYDVAPRYTCGSPALVSRRTGEGVAKDERDAYERHLEGLYGEEGKAKAMRLGLSRIVWTRVREEHRGKRCVIHNLDAITGERWTVEAVR